MAPWPNASRAALCGTALWCLLGAPAAAVPGEPLDAALRWLEQHPFLGPPRLAPAADLGVALVFDAWQASRLLPGGAEVRLFLDVVEPRPHPPVKNEFADNRVRREILLIDQVAPPAELPPIATLVGRIYGPGPAEEYRSSEMIPLSPEDVPNGAALTSGGVGPLRFEYGSARKGGNLEFVESAYRGAADPFAAKPLEVRRTIVVISPGHGHAPAPPPPPPVTAAARRFW